MKTNYIPTDEVRIINPFCFAYGFDGDVLSNNPDASKQLTVILKGGNGTWSFKYSEVCLIKNNALVPLKTSDTPKPEIVKDVIEILEKVGFKQVKENEDKQKRKYTRRDKTEVKITRKYTKKAK